MKLGILSDNHGRIAPLRRAVALLNEAGAEAFIHCGDVGGLETLEELAGRPCWFVWGNTDYPRPGWRPHLESLGLFWPEAPLEIELAGKRIAVCHGHERAFFTVRDRANHDYLFHGHTHQRADHRVGAMRVVNPGALHRAEVKTVALLDLSTDELSFLEVDGDGYPA